MQADTPVNVPAPVIVGRSEHTISRSAIDPDALWIMRKLRREGHMAYLVGGAVRDLLLGREPKDFDIGTDAHPSAIRALFSNSRTIGRRFRIVHVFFRRKGFPEKVIEVSTFRATRLRDASDEFHPDDVDQTGTAFGTPEEDAWRRDFTVNAIFYNIDDFSVVDHTGGLADLKAKTLRVIGVPTVRYAEDPVRMLRALEFAVRLGFSIEEGTREGMRECASLIREASPARLREELRQMHQRGITGDVLAMAAELGLFAHLFPDAEPSEALFGLLRHIDRSPEAYGQNNEYAYIAALAMPKVADACPLVPTAHMEEAHDAVFPLVGKVCERYQISSHIRHMARELIVCCYRLARGRAYKAKAKFARRAEFPAALDFYAAWVAASGGDDEAVTFWKSFLSEKDTEKKPGKNRRRRRGGRGRGRGAGGTAVSAPAE